MPAPAPSTTPPRRRALILAPALACAGLSAAVTDVPAAQAAPALASGFSDALVAGVAQPTDVAPMPDGRLLVTGQRGQLRVVRGGALVSTPALDLTGRACTNSERGLLGVVADPDAATRAVYVFWTVRGGNSSCPTNNGSSPTASGSPVNRVSRFVFTAGTDRIDPASETVLIDGIPSPGGNHHGGDLGIGKDGLLYVAVGDGGCDYRGDSGCGGSNNASRDRNTALGKILRITRAGTVPGDNPWTGAGTARCHRGNAPSGTTCQEAFAVGLRNPFRIAFDPDARATTFRINDVGQNVWEEIDQGAKGADYGWNTREGRCANTGSSSDCGPAKPAGFTDPIHVYKHSGGCASITGGAYVPDAAWPAPWNSRYLFADYVCGRIMALGTDGSVTDLVTGLGNSSAVALSFGPTGAALPGAAGQSLYYTTYASGGQVRRITATGTANRTPTASLTVRPWAGEGWSDGGAATHDVITPATATALTANLGLRGLFAAYYPTSSLTGTPVNRLDAVVDADWGTGSPAAGIPADGFSARWSGQLLPQFSETYTITAVVDDSARLRVDGASVDRWEVAGPQTLTTSVRLTAGVPARIVLDFRERAGRARVQLRWSSASQPDQVVPTVRLLPRYAYSFRPATSPPPTGWTPDNGATYSASRATGHGWSRDMIAQVRDRAVLGDPLRDTLVHLQDATWEAALPPGTYRVAGVAGDPSYVDSRHVVDAEGQRLLSGVPTSAQRFVTGSVVMSVTDGRLTVRAGAEGTNVKLNSLTVELR